MHYNVLILHEVARQTPLLVCTLALGERLKHWTAIFVAFWNKLCVATLHSKYLLWV